MGWVDMSLEGAEPVQYPDNPDVIAAAEAKGYVRVGDLTAPSTAEAMEPDEVDDRGQGWMYLTHAETGGSGRFPVEVTSQMYAQGWARSGAETEALATEQTKADLQAQLKELGLSTSGTKQELVDRLFQANIRDYEATAVADDTEE